jgi:ubiquinone/menaquinone biosynthesis C-methylase UbiE
MNKDQVHEYKKETVNLYSIQNQAYDSSNWYDRMARKLFDYSNILIDSQVLDIATGTGMGSNNTRNVVLQIALTRQAKCLG